MIDAGQPPAPRRIAVLMGVAATVLAADIASKAAVVALLSGRRHVRLFGGLLTLLVARNPGAAFGLGGPSVTVAFTAVAAGVGVVIARSSRHISSTPWAVALGLLLGGAMGNLTDRLFRSPGPLQGWVVDYQVPGLSDVQHRGRGDRLRRCADRGARGAGHRGAGGSPGARRRP